MDTQIEPAEDLNKILILCTCGEADFEVYDIYEEIPTIDTRMSFFSNKCNICGEITYYISISERLFPQVTTGMWKDKEANTIMYYCFDCNTYNLNVERIATENVETDIIRTRIMGICNCHPDRKFNMVVFSSPDKLKLTSYVQSIIEVDKNERTCQ